MPKGRHTHYLRTSGRMLLSGMRSHERNYDANVATKIYIAINQLSFCICLITHSFYFYANILTAVRARDSKSITFKQLRHINALALFYSNRSQFTTYISNSLQYFVVTLFRWLFRPAYILSKQAL